MVAPLMLINGDVTMRMSPLLMLIFDAAVALLISANAKREELLSIDLNMTGSSSSSSHYSKTKNHEQITAWMEDSLFSFLGFANRPKLQNSPIHIPDLLRKLQARQNNIGTANIAKSGIHARSANTVRSFSHIESELDHKFQSSNRFRLFFDLSKIPSNEILQAAELSLSRVAVSDVEDYPKHVRVLVHDIVRPGVKGHSKAILRLINSKIIDATKNSTIYLDVYPVVARWLQDHHQNHGMIVHVFGDALVKKHEHVRLKRGVDEHQNVWVTRQPMLNTYTDDNRNKIASTNQMVNSRDGEHTKRDTFKTDRRRNNELNCKRSPLYVNFTDIGWNKWIVEPSGYEAWYCHGYCPYPLAEHMNATNHAILQNMITPKIEVPNVCCVPTVLNPLSVIYLEETNTVVLKNYDDMVVLECGCR